MCNCKRCRKTKNKNIQDLKNKNEKKKKGQFTTRDNDAVIPFAHLLLSRVLVITRIRFDRGLLVVFADVNNIHNHDESLSPLVARVRRDFVAGRLPVSRFRPCRRAQRLYTENQVSSKIIITKKKNHKNRSNSTLSLSLFERKKIKFRTFSV